LQHNHPSGNETKPTVKDLSKMQWNEKDPKNCLKNRQSIIKVIETLSKDQSIDEKTRSVYITNHKNLTININKRFQGEGFDCGCGRSGCKRTLANCQIQFDKSIKGSVQSNAVSNAEIINPIHPLECEPNTSLGSLGRSC